MDSPGHRKNILRPFFRDIGIAILIGAPFRTESRVVTYATDFGVIQR
jgi:uncharacterized protein YkwD